MHGHSKAVDGKPTRTYYAWSAMKRRCTNSNQDGSEYYKGLDIEFDPRWNLFENFLEDMGECPEGYELDRENNDLGYNKGNCRWITHKENMRNSSVASLTVEKVKQIKRLLKQRPKDQGLYAWDSRIAKLFGVGRGAIGNIRYGYTWTDIEAASEEV